MNGELKQRGELRDLIWSIPEVISAISQSVALAPGDLIYSGTPAGVGPMQPGDDVSGGVEGVAEFTLAVGPPGLKAETPDGVIEASERLSPSTPRTGRSNPMTRRFK